MTISYSLIPDNPAAHLFKVVLELSNPDPAGQLFQLPNWIPGSYMIRDFSKNIISMSATSDGEPVLLTKKDKSSWLAPAGLSAIRLEYTVYAWDLSVRSAHLDNEHGFFNGTSVYLMVVGQEDQPCRVEMNAPQATSFADWRLATSLKATDVKDSGYGLYLAEDYDDLIDHPVEMGTFERIEFSACGVPHEIILTGDYHTDNDRLAKDLKTICEAQIKFFGEPAPVDRYVFLVMVVGEGYGGLEHRASTALLVTRDHLPTPDDDSVDDKYMSFLGLCSHEYFHTWNVKRIKPAEFIPFKLEQESYTRLLWFFEGITSYYDDLFLVRTGLITNQQYFDLISKTITRVHRGAGRLVQSVTDSSFDAWNKFYKQDANAPNAIVSYYAKGALVSLCLDAEIRKATDGKKSLDDLMRLLWARWLENKNGLGEREPEALASQIAGKDLSSFFQSVLYTTEELPIESALSHLGAKLYWRARKSASDTGGGEASDEASVKGAPWFGANIEGGAGHVKITHVFNGSAAEQAGLAPGDILMALDHFVLSASGVADLLKRHGVGGALPLHYSRHGVLRETSLPLVAAPIDTCSVSDDAGNSNSWLAVDSLEIS